MVSKPIVNINLTQPGYRKSRTIANLHETNPHPCAMNRLCSLLAAAFFCWAGLCMQSCASRKSYADYSLSSGFSLDSLDACNPQVVENLGVLCRVWGYVKYHHPAFAREKYNIDYELFELLPRIAHADTSARNRVLCGWIDGLGPYDTAPGLYDSLPPNRLNDYGTDLGWTRDTLRLGQALSDRLLRLRHADRRAGNRYVTKAYYPQYNITTLNAGFDGEESYAGLTDPDCGYRLLAAFRFWNMVEYFFPYKFLTDKPWDKVLPEYTARMIALPDGSYPRTMWRMIAELNDSHAAATEAFVSIFGSYRAPITTAWVEGKVIVAAPDTLSRRLPSQAGFRVGDEIVAVGGRSMAYYKQQVRTYIPCSNEARVSLLASAAALCSPRNTSLRIRYRREGEERDTLVAVSLYWQNPGRNYGRYADLGDGIAYIDPATFCAEDEKPLAALLERASGLVVDLRHYPGANDAYRYFVGKYLLPDDYAFYSKCQCYTRPVISLPGVFASSYDPEPVWGRPQRSRFPIAVLVDNGTQSAGETGVQWFQTCADAVVVGNQSAGANGNVSTFHLPGGIVSCFSGLGWYYSDGVTVQRAGVRIDVEVQPTIEGVKAGRDEIMDKAVEILRSGAFHRAM